MTTSIRPATGTRLQSDVTILGGGLAGLTLAIQLKRRRPETVVTVLEKKQHPVTEASHKVGESSLFLGARYFAQTCGLREHLEERQIVKMGLRFFLADDHTDITRRTEIGIASWIDSLREYQIDRGRFENALGEIVRNQYGVAFLDGVSVSQVDLSGDGHRVIARRGGKEFMIDSPWIVDASGRAAILKRKLDLSEDNGHHCAAAWFRIAARVKIDDFSADPAWVGRVSTRSRWQSTNHLFGPGYWFWLIPLASGSTSFGLVADPDLVAWEDMRRFESLMEWLHRNEPQAAQAIEPHRAALQDFRILKHFSHGCKQVYSTARWCITGEAGYFHDPLYSPGSDAIALSNTLVTELVTRSLDGRDVDSQTEFFNSLYLLLCKHLLPMWDHQYAIFGNPGVSAVKLNWDYVPYLSGLALLVSSERITDMDYTVSVFPSLLRISELNINMQRFLRHWAACDPDAASKVGYMGIREDRFLCLEQGVSRPPSEPELVRSTLEQNAANLEAAALEIMARAAASVGIDVAPDRLNPYVFDLAEPHAAPPDDLPAHMVPLGRHDADSGILWATADDEDAATHRARSTWRPLTGVERNDDVLRAA